MLDEELGGLEAYIFDLGYGQLVTTGSPLLYPACSQ